MFIAMEYIEGGTLRAEALKLATEDEERYRAGTDSAYNVARIYAGLGEKEKALG